MIWGHALDLTTRHDGRAFVGIATDNRLVFYDCSITYGIETDTGLLLRMWRNTSRIFTPRRGNGVSNCNNVKDGSILIVNYYRDREDTPKAEFGTCITHLHNRGKLTYAEKLRSDFKKLEKLTPLTLDLGGGKTRKLNFWARYGYTRRTNPNVNLYPLKPLLYALYIRV